MTASDMNIKVEFKRNDASLFDQFILNIKSHASRISKKSWQLVIGIQVEYKESWQLVIGTWKLDKKLFF